MIKGKDLRIGNWVYSNGFRGKVQVTLLVEKDYEDCEPIPLSPEVLQGLGFKFLNGDIQKWMHLDSLVRLIPSDDKPGQYFLGGFSGSKNICYIKNLHHLQNIVFDLLGIELTYNPNQP